MPNIVIVDLGTGNLRSVYNAVQHVCVAMPVSACVCVSDEPAVIAAAGHLILPGQGALGAWMQQLNADSALRAAVLTRLQRDRGPVLGICLGLQALYAHSAENGGTAGLGLLKGVVRHFSERRGDGATANAGGENSLGGVDKIPHMGWNRVRHTRAHPLWRGIADRQRFYFANSYFVDSEQRSEVVGECEYGGAFTAAAAQDNLFATQFHPEKSQRAGLQLLQNFVHWNGGL